jgi:hypothetical protein
MPTPNRGAQAAALATVRNVVDQLGHALTQLGPGGAGSDVGQAVLKAMQALSKHVPPGATTPGAQKTSQEQFMMQQRQQNPLSAVLAAMGGGGAGGPPGGASAPGPSPPLPGG